MIFSASVDIYRSGFQWGTFSQLNSEIKFTYLLTNPCSLSKARNIGLDYVEGEYIAFPDDDCWYEPDTLSKVLNQLEFHDGVLVKATNEEGILVANYPNSNKRFLCIIIMAHFLIQYFCVLIRISVLMKISA